MTEFLRKAPFVRLILPFIVGLILGFNFQLVHFIILWFVYITFILAFGFVMLRKISGNYKCQQFYGFIINLFLIGSGAFMAQYQVNRYSNQYLPTDKKIEITCLLADYPEERANSYKCIVKVYHYTANNFLISFDHKVMLYFQKSKTIEALKAGDIVRAKSWIAEIRKKINPSPGFDYGAYMVKQGIVYQGYTDSLSWKIIERDQLNVINKLAIQCREKLLDTYRNVGFTGRELGVISALTIGYKADLDADIKQAYTAAGAMHILAVSGMHVGLIYIVLGWILQFLKRIKKGKIMKGIVVIVMVWFYTLLAGLSPSVMRASVMITFLSFGQMADRKLNVYNSLALAAFLLLAINPYDLMDVGFQLSFLAVIGIVALYPLINNWVSSHKIVNEIWSLVAVSLAAQLATFPLSLYYFHQFPNYFIVANLIVVPLATLVIYGSIGLLFLYTVQFFWVLFSKVLYFGVYFLNAFVFRIENLPFSMASNININIYELLLWYFLVVVFILFLVQKKAGYLLCCCVGILGLIWLGIGRIVQV
jgi:competence protein ComEC